MRMYPWLNSAKHEVAEPWNNKAFIVALFPETNTGKN